MNDHFVAFDFISNLCDMDFATTHAYNSVLEQLKNGKNSGPAFLCDNNCVTLLKVTWLFLCVCAFIPFSVWTRLGNSKKKKQ